ncbi:MAG: type III pantothenate kinase [Alphaproteobacteria bacterium]|nr:type III pantothenate kinase [Alphaproteobacteria bacterium]
MLLAIDSGNTNVQFALYDGARQVASWRCGNDPHRTADEYVVWLSQLMSLQDIRLADLTGTIIASVVPDTLFNLKRLCEKHVPGDVMVVGERLVDLGIEVLIDRPEQVGADRLVGVVAAHAKYGGPVMVLDFGTATSFDVADAAGNFRGGVLAPGVRLSVEALYMAAAKLPRIEIRPPERVIGRATIPAMESGVYWGYVSMIDGMIGRIQAEYGEPMKVVATGGLSALFANATDRIDITDQNLMMDGLIEIHRRNT